MMALPTRPQPKPLTWTRPTSLLSRVAAWADRRFIGETDQGAQAMASAGSITAPVNVDPLVSIDTLHLNDGDVLILRCAGPLTEDTIDYLRGGMGHVSQATGKRVAVIVLDPTVGLDHLTAAQARRLCDRLDRAAGGEGEA
jgi:hypothetical protein